MIQKRKKRRELLLQQNADKPHVIIQSKIPITPFLQFSVSNLVNDSKLKTRLCLDDITIFTYTVSRLLGIIAQDLPKAELSYLAYLSSFVVLSCWRLLVAWHFLKPCIPDKTNVDVLSKKIRFGCHFKNIVAFMDCIMQRHANSTAMRQNNP